VRLGETRYSTLAQINTDNVKNLKGAWMARLGSGFDNRYSQQGTPLVKDGVMFIPTGQQDIFALKAQTGELLWKYTSDVNPRGISLWANRGVALGLGSVSPFRPTAHSWPSTRRRQNQVDRTGRLGRRPLLHDKCAALL